MFMPAHAISALTLGDTSDQSPAGKQRLLDHKMSDNIKSTAWGSVGNRETRKTVFDREGVKEPLEIGHYRNWDQDQSGWAHNDTVELDNGHHRLSWAMHKDPKTELPVEHHSYGHDD
jgi:hypothetical protein